MLPVDQRIPSDTAEIAAKQWLNLGNFSITEPMQDITAPNEDEYEVVSVSSVFLPNADINFHKPDAILLSSDAVRFYVHSNILQFRMAYGLLAASTTRTADGMVMVQLSDSADIVNIMLHAIYAIHSSFRESFRRFNHSFQDTVLALDRLRGYGVETNKLIVPSNPIYEFLLSQSPLFPLPTYALAAHHEIESLAVAASAHLLSFPLPSIQDQIAIRIGPVYLKRLLLLHHRRKEELVEILNRPYKPHPEVVGCSFERQKSVGRAWTLAAAHLLWEGRPDVSNHTLESTFLNLTPAMECDLCRDQLKQRVRQVITEWSLCKHTI